MLDCVTACVVYGRFDSRFDSNEMKTIRRSLGSGEDQDGRELTGEAQSRRMYIWRLPGKKEAQV